jgi:c-di-GMP-binding flagellar brake protein YcgR
MNQKESERRRYIRVGMQISVSYVVFDEVRESKVSIAKDISGGGMRLPLKEKLTVGTLLELQLELLKQNKTIVLEAKVVWIKPHPEDKDYPYEAGIEFLGIGAVQRSMISNYIQYLNRSELTKEYFR